MIIISPYSKSLRNGKTNPKNYPYWKELIRLINEPIVQVGIDGEEQLVNDFRKNLSLTELGNLVDQCKTNLKPLMTSLIFYKIKQSKILALIITIIKIIWLFYYLMVLFAIYLLAAICLWLSNAISLISRKK